MKNKLIKDSFFILLANGITFLTSMIITKIISSSYSLTDYGFRSQILTIVSLLTSFLSLGLSNAANYFVPLTEKKDENTWISVLRNIYVISAPICLMVIFIVFLFGNGIGKYFGNPELSDYKLFIAILTCEHIIYSLYAGAQISQHKALRSTLTNLSRSITTVIVVSAVCILHGNIRTVIAGTICVDAVFCFYTVADVTRLNNRIGKWISFGLIRQILQYSIPLGISTITGTLCAHIDKLFISKLLTLDDLAIYTNMCTELPLSAVSGAFIAVITPYIVKMIGRNEIKKAVDLWGYIIELVSIILFPIITFLFVFPKQSIAILYSKEYVSGYQLFRLFTVLELSRMTYFGLILRSYGKSVLILMCSVLTFVLNTILNIIFYFCLGMGMYGFALATLLSTFSILFLQLIMSCKMTGLRISQIFPWMRLLKCALINIGLGLFATIISKAFNFYESFQIWKFVVLGTCWLSVYFAISFNRAKAIYRLTKSAEL